jgi:hypothetical protein
MTGKRRWSAYLAASVMMTLVEYLTNSNGLGMSLNYQVAMLGVSGIHFGGIAMDKFKNGSNDGTNPQP